MNDNMRAGQKIRVQIDRERMLDALINPKGRFVVQHFREGEMIGEYDLMNGVTNVGKDKMLDVMFDAAAQLANWYIGLIDNAGGPVLAAADTMASHAGWAEFTGYTEANRVAWGPDPASGQAISNSVLSVFNINASGTIYGIFTVSDNTKAGSAGTLWATGAFASPVPVVSSDQLKITYTVSLT